MQVLPFQPNHRTATRLRAKREAEKRRLIERSGIRPEDASLFNEEIRFLAYAESLGRE